jgi:hypothetical protein
VLAADGPDLPEGALPRDTDASREADGRRAGLLDHDHAVQSVDDPPLDVRRGSGQPVEIGARTHPQDYGAPRTHEGKTPFGCHGWRGEGLREGNAGAIDRLLLCAAANDRGVLGPPAIEELALATVGLEQLELAMRQVERQWNAGRAVPRPDVDDEPASSTSIERAGPSSSEVSPGVSTTALSQSSSWSTG